MTPQTRTKPLRIVVELELPKEIGFADATAMAAQIVRPVELIETAVGESVQVHHQVERVVVEIGYATEEPEDE